MSGSARRRRAPSDSEEAIDDSHNSSSQASQMSSSPSSEPLIVTKKSRRPTSVHSTTSSATASDSQTSPPSSSQNTQRPTERSSSPKAPSKSKSRSNGKKPKRPATTSTDSSIFPPSTSSSGFSSAVSDTSAHSTTSGTSSPYASGSVFHRLSPNDIKYRDEKPKVLRGYIVGRLLGEGSYGKVKEGIDSKTKKMVAIKILSKKTLRRVPGGEASVEREIGIIESLSNRNVISILTHFPIEAKQKFYIVFEYMGGGNLTALLESAPNKRLPLYQARKLFLGLLVGLEHLRDRRVLHRDIKPDNLLLDDDGELKIADFGVAEVIPDASASVGHEHLAGIGSPAFQAPELIASPTLAVTTTKRSRRIATDSLFKSDIWSAGIVLFIMVVGQYPFPIQGNIMLLFENIAAGKYEIPDWLDLDCADLITQMLQTNPSERIDLAGIRTHPWVKNSIAKTTTVPLPHIGSMWPNHDKSSLSSTVKKMKPQLEREAEQERASRLSFDAGRPSFDEGDMPPAAHSSRSGSQPQSKCSIM